MQASKKDVINIEFEFSKVPTYDYTFVLVVDSIASLSILPNNAIDKTNV